MDVHGNDNTPEWGYCTTAGCHEVAFPIWLSGTFPDDADLLLCEEHIGAHIARQDRLIADLRAAVKKLLEVGATSAKEIARFYALGEGAE